tara:strand:+ start:982 stop:1776 length:795 start_codon:yes stop_codon:yes gene_type:complete
MGKYINVPIKMYAGSTATNAPVADSGTTDAATEGKLTQSGQNFATTVNVGDYAVITTAVGAYAVRTYALVTKVDSDTVLSVTGAALPATGTGGLSASGTAYSIVAAADGFDCVLNNAGFTATVSVGDIVCNETTNLNYTITAVDRDNKTLLIDRIGGVLVGDDFFILSETSPSGQRAVSLDKVTELRGNASNGEVTFHYKRGGTNQKFVIAMGDTVTDDAYFTKFREVALSAWKSRWSDVAVQMPINPSSGTQGLQWADSFTFS